MINEGGNVTLYCNTSGMPSPFVSWVKDGQRLINESKLELTNISRSQAGEYRCEASNECGHASETTNIDVKCKLIMVFWFSQMKTCGSVFNEMNSAFF